MTTGDGHDTPLLLGVVGSQAYGLATEASDTDRLGVYAAPTVSFHGLYPDMDASRVTVKPDVAWHEAGKAARLLLKCNPTMTELLWLPDYEVVHPLGAELVGMRDAFLSRQRVRDAYLGYAHSQLQRLQRRGDGSFSADTRSRTAKHARHLWRLCQQAVQLGVSGRLTVALAEDHAESCRRFGEQVAAGDVDAALEALRSAERAFGAEARALPEEPDADRVEAWLRRVRAALFTPGS